MLPLPQKAKEPALILNNVVENLYKRASNVKPEAQKEILKVILDKYPETFGDSLYMAYACYDYGHIFTSCKITKNEIFSATLYQLAARPPVLSKEKLLKLKEAHEAFPAQNATVGTLIDILADIVEILAMGGNEKEEAIKYCNIALTCLDGHPKCRIASAARIQLFLRPI